MSATATFNEEAFVKMATSVKMAAFVDELVKIASETGEMQLLEGIIDQLTPAQEEFLKQAGFGDWLGAAKKGLQGAGTAIAGGAQKAMGAVQNMGAGGAAKRMQAAGAAHDLDKMHFGGGQLRAPAPGAAAAAMPQMKASIDPSLARGGSRNPGFNPQQVSKGLVAQDLQRSAADIKASTPRAVPAGQPRFNPLDVSAASIAGPRPAAPAGMFMPPPRPAAAIPAMGTVHQLPQRNAIPAMRMAA